MTDFISRMPEALPGWPLQLQAQRYNKNHHGDYERWRAALAALPEIQVQRTDYGDTVSVSGSVDAAPLSAALKELHPWRKGPFRIGPVHIDTEWRSDWKWARLQPHLQLRDARVLDIGCGNGYFGWRMLQMGAAEVIGIDPTLLFCMQHQAVQFYMQDHRNWVLPLKVEEVPATCRFDCVFSMGVIYHRRDPFAHVQQLFELTRPGGRVVLESIVSLDGNLQPRGRYARMRNVWLLPSPGQLLSWLQAAGFTACRLLDTSATTVQEQRSTGWMHFESLQQALDPDNPQLTVEGYPAPVRAVVTAQRPVTA